MQALLLKYWKEIGIGLITVGVAYIGYSYIYNIGYSAATEEYNEKIKYMESLQNKRIKELEGYAKANLEQTVINNLNTSKDIKAILSRKPAEPTTTIINGNCMPSNAFKETYNAIIERANK